MTSVASRAQATDDPVRGRVVARVSGAAARCDPGVAVDPAALAVDLGDVVEVRLVVTDLDVAAL